MNRALFVDRDGILDHLVYYESSGEWEAPRRLEDLVVIEESIPPLRRLAAAGWLLVVVTNQPSYAKGKVSKESLLAVHRELLERVALPISASYICFHHPEGVVPEESIACECRKPGTRFLRQAAEDLEIDLSASWMVGDQDSDLLCGRAAGCRVALIPHEGSEHKRGAVEPDLRCNSVEELVSVLLATVPSVN